jgi:hypothetical protein
MNNIVTPESLPSRGLARCRGSARLLALLADWLGSIRISSIESLGVSGASPYQLFPLIHIALVAMLGF